MPVIRYKDPNTGEWVPLPTIGPSGPTGPSGSPGPTGPTGPTANIAAHEGATHPHAQYVRDVGDTMTGNLVNQTLQVGSVWGGSYRGIQLNSTGTTDPAIMIPTSGTGNLWIIGPPTGGVAVRPNVGGPTTNDVVFSAGQVQTQVDPVGGNDLVRLSYLNAQHPRKILGGGVHGPQPNTYVNVVKDTSTKVAATGLWWAAQPVAGCYVVHISGYGYLEGVATAAATIWLDIYAKWGDGTVATGTNSDVSIVQGRWSESPGATAGSFGSVYVCKAFDNSTKIGQTFGAQAASHWTGTTASTARIGYLRQFVQFIPGMTANSLALGSSWVDLP